MQFIDLRKQVVRPSEGLGGFDSGLSINIGNTTTKRRRQQKRYASQIVTSLLVCSACAVGPREGSTAVAFPPPPALVNLFSGWLRNRKIPLFSRVMREGLFTDLLIWEPEIGL